MKTVLRTLLCTAAVTLGLLIPAAQAQVKTVRVASGLSAPVAAVSAPGDFERLYIVEQTAGRIRVLKNGVLQPVGSPFLNIFAKITAAGQEQGLLGMAFHPLYPAAPYIFVNYTRTGDGATVIERYTVTNPDTATTTGSVPLKTIGQPQSNHNGGCLQFGPDGYLYVGMGDGGNFNDTGTGHAVGGNAQSGTTLLGKMLRLDVDAPPNYIPASNPFVGDPNVLDEVWAMGVRNPWRFSFDKATGDMYIGDVGQDAVEEIDFEPAGFAGGANYGWRCMEGLNCTGLSGCTCNAPTLTLPVHTYTHGSGCSVTGGHVYRGCAIPAIAGRYYFADYCANTIWSFKIVGGAVTSFQNDTALLAPGGGLSIGAISSFGEDQFGEVYICDRGGEVFKLVPTSFVSDCNGNNIEDSCELAAGIAPDVNGNGIIDSCECTPPSIYCSPKFNSEFCLPMITSTGIASATAGSGFVVSCVDVLNNKSGLLFYGVNGQFGAPFQGGTLCVAPQVKRTPAVNSGGNPPPNDCSGVFAMDMNLFAVGGLGGTPLAELTVPGTVVNCQWWGRDPGFPAPDNTQLSGGLEYQICP